jgi:transposase
MTDPRSTPAAGRQDRQPPVREPARRILHPHAAGIDIGSERHYVAVPPESDPQPVRCFGCLTPDLQALAHWLKACSVDTAAVESTGVYWIPVAQVLEENGIDVYLVDARQAKNLPGRKTDVKDCQWLQELHSQGMLARAFRPPDAICVLRSYWRHRKGLVEMTAVQIQLMHKSLEQMNLQLHKVLSDVTGVTGLKIIRAILQGERNPVELARLKHPLVKSSEDTIAKALTGDWRAEHLFTLRQAVELYDIYQQKIEACDGEIEAYMKTLDARGDPKDLPPAPRPTRRKNQAHFDLRERLYEITGVDLTLLPGIDAMTAQTVVSECGTELRRFATEKHFSSWLGLCPNHEISGGKVLRRRTRRVRNRAARALRVAAQSLHKSKTALGAYYRRMRGRLGPAKAITATAHKLAILIYRMFRYGMEYVEQGQDLYEQQYQERTRRLLAKRVRQMGYAMVDLQTGEVVS